MQPWDSWQADKNLTGCGVGGETGARNLYGRCDVDERQYAAFNGGPENAAGRVEMGGGSQATVDVSLCMCVFVCLCMCLYVRACVSGVTSLLQCVGENTNGVRARNMANTCTARARLQPHSPPSEIPTRSG